MKQSPFSVWTGSNLGNFYAMPILLPWTAHQIKRCTHQIFHGGLRAMAYDLYLHDLIPQSFNAFLLKFRNESKFSFDLQP